MHVILHAVTWGSFPESPKSFCLVNLPSTIYNSTVCLLTSSSFYLHKNHLLSNTNQKKEISLYGVQSPCLEIYLCFQWHPSVNSVNHNRIRIPYNCVELIFGMVHPKDSVNYHDKCIYTPFGTKKLNEMLT